MIRVKLRKLTARTAIQSLVENLVNGLGTTVFIADNQGNILLGKWEQHLCHQYPVTANEDIIGWVHGEKKAQTIAQILSYIAQQEFEKKSLVLETLDKYEEINFLYDISSKMSTSLTIKEIIGVVIEETKNLLEFSTISFMLLNERGELDIFSVVEGEIVKTQGTVNSIAGYILQSGREEVINDVNQDSRYLQEEISIRSLICLPLKVCNETIGVIKISHTEPNSYTTEDLKLCAALTSQTAAAIRTAQYYNKLKDYSETLEKKVTERTLELEEANKKLEDLAIKDGLTQLHNRRYFDEYFAKEWRRLMREKQSLSLILCDVDYFKRFNDYYLHQAGDECLQKIAQVMKNVVKRPADLVARFGGEEFIIILSNTNKTGAMQVAKEILLGVENLKIRHALSPLSPYVTVSLGIATTIPNPNDPEPEVSANNLIWAADKALYRAKDSGRNCFK